MPPETVLANRRAEEEATGTPRVWQRSLAGFRAARRQAYTHSPTARDLKLPGPLGAPEVGARLFLPQGGWVPRAAVLHIHSGGFVSGSARGQNDARLEQLACESRLAILSVDYRLSPECPFPGPRDDCVAAAHWLARGGAEELGCGDRLLIYGESAGANLAVSTLCHLRDEHGSQTPFAAAALAFGIYDCTLTPSARHWGDRRLVATSQEIVWYVRSYCGAAPDLRDPQISPLFADLKGLPPALFTVGTADALLDDSLFMYARWVAAGTEASLALYPGAPHGVGHFKPGMETSQGREALARIATFLEQHL